MRLRVMIKLMHIIGEAYHTENIIPGYLSGCQRKDQQIIGKFVGIFCISYQGIVVLLLLQFLNVHQYPGFQR